MTVLQDRTMSLPALTLHYREAGEEDALPLILLHGLGGTARGWDSIAVALAESYHVFALDQRGHGTSSWPGVYSFELMRDDVEAFADALSLARFTLIGHSMGGTVAFLFSEQWPDRIVRLVSIDTAPPFVGDASLDAFDDDDAADEEEESDDSPTFDPQVWEDIFRQLRQPDPLWWSELPRISAPTLIIGGGSTSHVPQEKLAEAAELIPDCQLETIEGAGHMVFATRPEECEALLRRFLVR